MIANYIPDFIVKRTDADQDLEIVETKGREPDRHRQVGAVAAVVRGRLRPR